MDPEGTSIYSVTESAPTSPTKRQQGGRRGLARVFRGSKPAGPAAAEVRGLAGFVVRSSSATELAFARPPSAVSLDPIERRGLGRFGRLLGRKRPADDEALPASRAPSAAGESDAANGAAAELHRPRLLAGLRKRLHKS